MKGITVRNLPPELAGAVREKARKERLSLNKAVIRLIEEALGMGGRHKQEIHHDLDRFFGVWSREEASAFDQALSDQRRIDPETWK